MLVDFILGNGGRADGMIELFTCFEVQKMDELLADNEGEDLLSDLPGKLEKRGRRRIASDALIINPNPRGRRDYLH